MIQEWTRRYFIQSCMGGIIASWQRALRLHLSFDKNGKSYEAFSFHAQKEQSYERNINMAQGHTDNFKPAYVKLHHKGLLKEQGDILWNVMKSCRLCPRECGVNRLESRKGFCQATAQLQVASYHPHHGEERPLVGRGGSGTIFMTHCSLRCVFCINWEISQGGEGKFISVDDLATVMLSLQKMGCHNINVVTPTHYTPHIIQALDIAAGRGLRLPLVWNTCGWERMETLKLLDGIVDIYLPDFKYSDKKMASRFFSDADTYPEVTQRALLEMHRQVGVAKPESNGLMTRGLMIRHLVMPNNVSGTRDVIRWIAGHLPRDTYLNIMSQYRPMYRAKEFPEISRPLTTSEYREAVEWARKEGLTNLDIQGMY
jgi:putative pyruvate formate lyase activating enzyme